MWKTCQINRVKMRIVVNNYLLKIWKKVGKVKLFPQTEFCK